MSLVQEPQVMIVENSLRTDKCCNMGEKEYKIYNINQQLLMTGREELDCCCRACSCICRRDFDINMVSSSGQSLYTLKHSRMCCSAFGCCGCCRHRLFMEQNGIPIGSTEQDCYTCCTCLPSFSVKDKESNTIYKVQKNVDLCTACCNSCSCCCFSCVVPTGFAITGTGGNGAIEKPDDQRSAVSKEDFYTLTFPPQTGQEGRALLIATGMLVDYAMYDKSNPRQNMA